MPVTWFNGCSEIAIDGDFHAISVGTLRKLIIKNVANYDVSCMRVISEGSVASFVPFADDVKMQKKANGYHYWIVVNSLGHDTVWSETSDCEHVSVGNVRKMICKEKVDYSAFLNLE